MNPNGFPPCTTCGNTIRSRRCSCRTSAMLGAPNTNSQMYYDRSHPDCTTRMATKPNIVGPSKDVRDFIRSQDWSNKDYLRGMDYDLTDVYGSAVGGREKAMMKTFDNNLALASIHYPVPPMLMSNCSATPVINYPATTRYGMDYYDYRPDTKNDFTYVPY